MSAKRKMLAAREDLVNQVLEIAGRKNVKLYAMINDTLELVVKAENMGLSLEEVLNQYGILKIEKDAGFIPVVGSLWYDVVEKLFEKNKRWMIKKWQESGQWYGKYYSATCPKDPVVGFKEDMQSLIWDVSEFSVVKKKKESEVVLQCVSPGFSLSYTTLFASFLESAFEAMGYKCSDRSVSKGIVKLVFRMGESE